MVYYLNNNNKKDEIFTRRKNLEIIKYKDKG